MKCGFDIVSFRFYYFFCVYVRWEVIECDIDDLMYQQYVFIDQLMKGYFDFNCWLFENEKLVIVGEVVLEFGDNVFGFLEKFLLWIWDCEKKDFVFEI